MKFWFRFQLFLVSILLLATFSMIFSLVCRSNRRWDATREKIYSLSGSTQKFLKSLSGEKLEILAFYPQDDPARGNFEIFLKECGRFHPHFDYSFYDPDRVPRLARQYQVSAPYSVILRYQGRQERIVGPSEESFTNALLRLATPKEFGVCFVTGHDEASLVSEERGGLLHLKQLLEEDHEDVHEIILARDKTPPFCDVLVVAGPHQEMDAADLKILKNAFWKLHRGILFMIDPMDPGTGKSFMDFLKPLGVVLGQDVIVDKMSRVVGGDFLVPPIARYMENHPVTAHFDQPTFLPVARSVQPSIDAPKTLEVTPLALTGEGSWAESNLAALENGDAAFDSNADLAGPISVAAAVEKKGDPKGGRLIVVGDSDFLTNGFVHLAGNGSLGRNMIKWLTKDERFIQIEPKTLEFKPLFLNAGQRLALILCAVVLLPFLSLLIGAARVLWRKKTSV